MKSHPPYDQNQQELKLSTLGSFEKSINEFECTYFKAVFEIERSMSWNLLWSSSLILTDFGSIAYGLSCCGSLCFGVRHFILIHSRTLCCSKATAGILLKNAWVEVAVGFANRFSTKNHCGLGY